LSFLETHSWECTDDLDLGQPPPAVIPTPVMAGISLRIRAVAEAPSTPPASPYRMTARSRLVV